MTAPAAGPVIAGAPGPGALTLGRWAAETLGVRLLVAVVHPAPAALGSGRVDAEWVADRHRAAERILDEARKALEGADADYRAVASSSAAHGLHDLAEETGASLIVVGSGRDGPRERLYPGSTADRLLAGSVCPVAVAPAELATPPGTLGVIGVAYVDTPDGRAALAEAAKMAGRTGARLRLYTVVAQGDASLPFLIGQDAERAFLETARETYERSLEAAAASVPQCDTDWRIVPGDVVDTLAELDEVDVLFCGSRGYGPARRVLLGGVSARLIRRARRPVIVVPRSG
ncbi:universal stress protein [Actinoplanes sp. CA-030573]|uniref:universal stress protein n=1 Tax=Actinoplanes sp. CA-030573 TaxID=3239898 RepID=UPI003D9412CA